MKKIIAVLLSAVLLCSAFCINTSAAEISKEKEKLNKLINSYQASWWGSTCIYGELVDPARSDAQEVYDNENSTDYDYTLASNTLLNVYLNFDIEPEYAKLAYEKAMKEQNYNNWYTDEQWDNFQSKLSDLKIALEDDSYYSKKITKKFHAMLKAYNEMTNAYTVKGDLNKDGTVNILDVTLLQKHLANSVNLTGAQKMLAGAREYENPTITDVTTIQKYAVGKISEMPNNNVFISDENFSFMDTDLLMERTINFNICPRTLEIFNMYSPLENNYIGIDFLISYYKWCAENGCEP